MQSTLGASTGLGSGRYDSSLLWRAPTYHRPVRCRKGLAFVVRAQLVHPNCCSVTRTAVPKEAVLCSRFKGHTGPVLSMLVKTDEDGKKELVTSSLDKTLALWNLEAVPEAEVEPGISNVALRTRVMPSGAPIFSLAEGPDYYPQDQERKRKAGVSMGMPKQVFCGNADGSVVAWAPPMLELNERQPPLAGHDGWVRALATFGTPNASVLISAACNRIHMWRLDIPKIKELVTVQTPKEDVLALATGPSYTDPSKGRLYTGSNDGTIRVYTIRLQKAALPALTAVSTLLGSKDGNGNGPVAKLEEQKATLVEEVVGGRMGVSRAHMDRINAMAYHKNFLYTVSRDGALRMWDAATMTLVAEVKNAHDGEPITCVVVGPDNYLYTGGNDHFVRRWTLGELEAAENHALYGHNKPVRSLAAGDCEIVVSADASGEIAVWKV